MVIFGVGRLVGSVVDSRGGGIFDVLYRMTRTIGK